MKRREFCMTATAALAACAAPANKEAIQAIDCHAHVFTQGLKLANERRYAPNYDATIAQYLAMLDANGASHGVLVQPSFLGTDNSYMIEALRTAPRRLKGIAVVEPGIEPEELRALADAGIVGLRLNLIGRPDPDFGQPVWRRHLDRVAALGWQIEVQAEARRQVTLLPRLVEAGVTAVADHFGLPDKVQGIDDPAYRALLDLAKSGRIWVKLSGAYRNAPGIAEKAAPLLLAAFGPGRLVWGSDWPHTSFEKKASVAEARRGLEAWVPDAKARNIVLTSAPAELFRFTG